MNNEYKEMLERFDQICQNAKKELLCEKEEKQNDIRHFILETKDYGNFDVVEYEKYKELQEENKKLKELCDKYEEEHNTTFEYWKHLIKEDYKTRIDKAIELLLDKYVRGLLNDNEVNNIVKILKGDNK